MTFRTRRRFSARATLGAAIGVAGLLSGRPAAGEVPIPELPPPIPPMEEIATQPLLERPTRFDRDLWMLYGWRLRLRTEAKGIFRRDLIDPSDDGETFLRARLRAETQILPRLDARLDGRVNLRYERTRNDKDDVGVDGELSEGWLRWRQPLGLPVGYLQGGRIRFRDPRSWWWDEDFESALVGIDTSLWKGVFGVGSRLTQNQIDDDGRRNLQKDLTWIFAELRHQWRKDNFVELRLLRQYDTGDDETPGTFTTRIASNEDLLWIGGRLEGRTAPHRGESQIHYWLEAAGLGGRETRLSRIGNLVIALDRRDVSEWALDAGATWASTWPGRLSFTLAFASGSRRFRQPSLSRNRVVFNDSSTTRFRRYGEVLRPSLSNLHVLTAAVGAELARGVWLETLFHRYWQQDAQGFLVDDGLARQPAGSNRDIGQALDVVLGVDAFEGWHLEAIYGALFAGSAWGGKDGDVAQRATLLIRRLWP